MADKFSKRSFVIQTEEHLNSAISHLLQSYRPAITDGTPLHVHVTTKQDSRTVAQNRLYWMWIGQVSAKTGNDKDDLHFEFKKKFLIAIFDRDDQEYAEMCHAIKALKDSESEQYAAIAKGVIHETSTTRLTTKQFTEYLNAVNDYALAKLGIMLTVPDELQFALDK